MKYRNALIATALSVVTVGAFAQDRRYDPRHDQRPDSWYDQRREPSTPRIDDRQALQEERIQRGIDNGRLTRREAVYLQREQRDIHQAERSFKADGVVTRDEYAQLVGMLDRASEHIRARLREDGRDRRY